MKTIDEIREIFRHDTFATNNGAVIDEVGEGYAKCSLEIGDGHRNAAGAQLKNTDIETAYNMLVDILNNPEREEDK